MQTFQSPQNAKYFKAITANLTHHDYTYKEGLNEFADEFNSDANCKPGGFYFSDLTDIARWICLHDNNKWIYEVELCSDSRLVKCDGKYKTDKFILKNPVLIGDFLKKYNLEIDAVSQNWRALDYIQDQTDEIYSAAAKCNGSIFKYIRVQTPKICLTAVCHDGHNLKYVNYQTHEICLAAVNQYGCALKYVRKQTHEICLAAVRQDGHALYHVLDQTHKICLAAVSENGLALYHVKNQTHEICLAAVKQYGYALRYIKDQTLEICSIAVALNSSFLEYIRDPTIKNKLSINKHMN